MSDVVLDTHALIWFVAGERRKLGRRAKQFFEAAESGHGRIHVPTIALGEIVDLQIVGRLRLKMSIRQLTLHLFNSPVFEPVNLSVPIVLIAADLPMIRDPRGRLIAATAIHLDLPLMSKDPDIARSEQVRILW